MKLPKVLEKCEWCDTPLLYEMTDGKTATRFTGHTEEYCRRASHVHLQVMKTIIEQQAASVSEWRWRYAHLIDLREKDLKR